MYMNEQNYKKYDIFTYINQNLEHVELPSASPMCKDNDCSPKFQLDVQLLLLQIKFVEP